MTAASCYYWPDAFPVTEPTVWKHIEEFNEK